MTIQRRKKIIVGGVLIAASAIIASIVGVTVLRRRFEPYVRAQAIAYLEKRFDSDVEMASLHIRIPTTSPVRMILALGRGSLARVEGTGLVLRQKGREGLPPVLALKKFSFEVDLGALFDARKTIERVAVEGMQLNVPPKGDRKPLEGQGLDGGGHSDSGVVVKELIAKDSQLVIMTNAAAKIPLTFNIGSLRLNSVGKDLPMHFDAMLTNPKPRGLIHSKGTFGPWWAEEPGETPLQGNYTFDDADLSVFPAIAGVLRSSGEFTGTLSSIDAKGTASVPDFRLKSAGNPVPLSTSFEVLVDGGNGNTILQPVQATLGSTAFTTSGGVIRKDGDDRRSIDLDVSMAAGRLRDVLRLTMKTAPFMDGQLALRSKIAIPPLSGKVKEKLLLDGRFVISHGRFLRSGIQSKIDSLSRRAQGQPQNDEIAQVLSDMNGNFRMEDQTITFRSLTFSTPGANIDLAGDYNLSDDALDFHGSLGLQARVSEMVTGWKRWALKPADRFFARNGAGTFLHIRIGGTSKAPSFGVDLLKREGPKEVTGVPQTEGVR